MRGYCWRLSQQPLQLGPVFPAPKGMWLVVRAPSESSHEVSALLGRDLAGGLAGGDGHEFLQIFTAILGPLSSRHLAVMNG